MDMMVMTNSIKTGEPTVIAHAIQVKIAAQKITLTTTQSFAHAYQKIGAALGITLTPTQYIANATVKFNAAQMILIQKTHSANVIKRSIAVLETFGQPIKTAIAILRQIAALQTPIKPIPIIVPAILRNIVV